MKPAALTENIKADGLRAVCEAPLPHLCYHAEYRICVNGQYIESAGNLGSNAAHVLEFYQHRRRGKSVEIRPMACQVRGCNWGRS
jgi:hypothetical protein